MCGVFLLSGISGLPLDSHFIPPLVHLQNPIALFLLTVLYPDFFIDIFSRWAFLCTALVQQVGDGRWYVQLAVVFVIMHLHDFSFLFLFITSSFFSSSFFFLLFFFFFLYCFIL